MWLCFQVCALQDVCISQDEGSLLREAKKWATKAAKDYKIINHGERVSLEGIDYLYLVKKFSVSTFVALLSFHFQFDRQQMSVYSIFI